MFIREYEKKWLFEKTDVDYLDYIHTKKYDDFSKLEEKNKKIILILKKLGKFKLIREVLRFTIPIEKIKKIEPYYIATNDMWLINYVFYNIGKNGEKLNNYLNYIKKENNKIVQKYLNYSVEELKKEFDKNDIYKKYYYDEKDYNENIKVESILPSSIIFYYVSNNLEEDEIVNFCLNYRIERLKQVKIYEEYPSYNTTKEMSNSEIENFETNLYSFSIDFDEEKDEDSENDYVIG